MTRYALTILLAAAAGCAADRGTAPRAMGADEHLAAARAEEEAAAAAREQYDASAWSDVNCRGVELGERPQPCWKAVANPTAWRLEEARLRSELAAKHRAASRALREAEAAACAGLSDRDRDESPLLHREDIAAVRRLLAEREAGRGEERRLLGATVVFRPVPGLDVRLLQRLLDCHVARAAALGPEGPDAATCPLALPGVAARAGAAGGRLSVSIASEHGATAREILRRAEALAAGPGPRGRAK